MRASTVIHLTIGKANPERANGVSVAVHSFASGLVAIGYPVVVWGITDDPEAPTPDREYPLRLFRSRRWRFSVAPELRAALESLPSDCIVHLHGGLLPEFHGVARILARHRIPWVLTPHGCYAPKALEHHPIRKRLFLSAFDRSVLGGAARIHAVGPGSADGLTQRKLRDKTVQIPNGSPPPHPPFATPGTTPRAVTFCGRLDRAVKGLDALLGGLAIARASVPDLTLNIVGDGPDRSALERLTAQLSLEDRVRFHGPLFGDAKRAILLASNAFALTSRHEGFPMSLVEAAATGLPLLVTPATNFAARVEEWQCGTVAMDCTPEAIAAALIKVGTASAATLNADGMRGVQMVQEELAWSRVAARLRDEIYLPIERDRSR